jgi:hypothetical protein
MPLVAEAYPALSAYQAWLDANRRTADGMYAWAHAYESGVENAPRFASRDERRLDDTRGLAAPDFCAYVALQLEALAWMAARLGLPHEAQRWEAQRTALRNQIDTRLWDRVAGLYFDRDTVSGDLVRTRTIASLLPLWAGAPAPDRAARMVEQVMDPAAFASLIPLPSVALNDPTFERDMWRGPVWVNTAFAVILGLLRYGYQREAAELAWRLIHGVFECYARHGRFYEFYDPSSFDIAALHRKRGNAWKRVSLGDKPVADFVGWTGLVDTLVIEVLFGLHRARGGYALQPRFPKAAWGRRFSLTLPQIDARILLQVAHDGSVTGRIAAKSGTRAFRASFAERVPFPEPNP